MNLNEQSILFWMQGKKTETGDPIDLKSHYFLAEIYRDFTPILAWQKPAQIGATTAQIFKTFFGMKKYGLDSIYTLPTISDANEMSKGKINRLIAQNPELKDLVKELDTIGQKQVGDNILYIRGTHTTKAAMMHSSDWNNYDEVDASNQDVIEQYSTRLQHSEFRWEHTFSHPSSENVGVNKVFQKSDQKHFFIRCEHCNKQQFLEWGKSIEFTEGPRRTVLKARYICKFCKKGLSDDNRRKGEWVKKHNDREVSGYQCNLLMASWVTAKQISEYHLNKSAEYFTNKVLGLPYVGAGNKVTWEVVRRNITKDINEQGGRIVIGVDTGTTTWYVVGNRQGIFYYGSCKGYDEIEKLLKRYKNSVAVFDQGGDLMAPRNLQEKYGKGRIFLCHYSVDRKTKELVRWGKNEEQGNVIVDRNRTIQLLVDEFTDGRIPLQMVESEQDWHDYFLHWNNIYRVEEENSLGVPVKRWMRSGDDHWCFVAGTKILTREGEKNIEDVTTDDYALTRDGYKKVERSWKTGDDKEVITCYYGYTNRQTLTSNHPVWVEGKGFVPAGDLTSNDVVLCVRKKNLMELSTAVTQNLKEEATGFISHLMVLTGARVLVGYIKKFGGIIMGKFQKVLLSTIKTTTPLIMPHPTCSVFQRENISQTTQKKGLQTQKQRKEIENILIKSGKIGIKAKKGKSYTKKWERKMRSFCTMEGHTSLTSVQFVKKNTKPGIEEQINTVQLNVDQVSTIKNTIKSKEIVTSAKQLSLLTRILGERHVVGFVQVRKLVKQKKRESVYNLTVKDKHEYFANGILVSNCHSTVYWRVGMSKYGEGTGATFGGSSTGILHAPEIQPDGTIVGEREARKANDKPKNDWRIL